MSELVGTAFGRWVVEAEAPPYIFPSTGYSIRKLRCKCSCGKSKDVRLDVLLRGQSKSCGCMAAEAASNRLRTHGLSQTPLYHIWTGMNKRCNNKNSKDFHHYGGRGIVVCERWHSDTPEALHNFIEDMQCGYLPGLEIDRIDTDKGYCKENCRWATRQIQVINRRPMHTGFDAHFLEYGGKRLCISQWADEVGIPGSVISDRIGKLGWSIEKALTAPARVKRILIKDDDTTFMPRDVYKTPPSLYRDAKKYDMPIYTYLACLLSGFFEVFVEVSKVMHRVEPTKNLSDTIGDRNIRDQFIETLKERGWDEKVG